MRAPQATRRVRATLTGLTRHAWRGSGARGTVLLLFPAAVLIVLVLGALTVDMSLLEVRGRDLDAAAGSAANDAVGALDVAALRNGDGIAFDPDAALEIARESVRRGPVPDAVVEALIIDRDRFGRPRIAVTLRASVDFVMAPALGSRFASADLSRTRSATVLE